MLSASQAILHFHSPGTEQGTEEPLYKESRAVKTPTQIPVPQLQIQTKEEKALQVRDSPVPWGEAFWTILFIYLIRITLST